MSVITNHLLPFAAATATSYGVAHTSFFGRIAAPLTGRAAAGFVGLVGAAAILIFKAFQGQHRSQEKAFGKTLAVIGVSAFCLSATGIIAGSVFSVTLSAIALAALAIFVNQIVASLFV